MAVIEAEKEVIVFALVQDGQILLSKRTDPSSFWLGEEIIPAGGIEKEDYGGVEDYRETALKRELMEELGVIPTQYHFLFTKQYLGESNLLLHIYAVTGWERELVQRETGKEVFFWRSLVEVLNTTKWLSIRETIRAILENHDPS